MKETSEIKAFSEALAKRIDSNREFYVNQANDLHIKNVERRVRFIVRQLLRIDQSDMEESHKEDTNDFIFQSNFTIKNLTFDSENLSIKNIEIRVATSGNKRIDNEYIMQNLGVGKTTPFCVI